MTARKTRRQGGGAKASKKPRRTRATSPVAQLPRYVEEQLRPSAAAVRPRAAAGKAASDLRLRLAALGTDLNSDGRLLDAIRRIDPRSRVPIADLPPDVRATLVALKAEEHRFHGAKLSLAWFPWPRITSPCADKFGYLTSGPIRARTKLPFNATTMGLLDKLGEHDGRPGPRNDGRTRRSPPASPMSVSSSTTTSRSTCPRRSTRRPTRTRSTTCARRRWTSTRCTATVRRSIRSSTPSPRPGPPTAIKLQLGSNRDTGPGGPARTDRRPGRDEGRRPTSTCRGSTTP